MFKKLFIGIVVISSLLSVNCSNKNVPVAYGDPASTNPLTTDFSLTDLKIIANQLVDSLVVSNFVTSITNNDQLPILIVQHVQNRTDQHIDTESITDTIRTELIQSNKFLFTDAATRNEQKEELLYQKEGGMVDESKAIALGQQFGAGYTLNGAIVSYQERTNKTLRKSYKFTLNLINLKTGIIEWAQEVPIVKIQSRSAMGR